MEDKGFLTMQNRLVTFYFYKQFTNFHCYFLKGENSWNFWELLKHYSAYLHKDEQQLLIIIKERTTPM